MKLYTNILYHNMYSGENAKILLFIPLHMVIASNHRLNQRHVGSFSLFVVRKVANIFHTPK